jgi:aspartate/methionine/tyrosine aminotransferase
VNENIENANIGEPNEETGRELQKFFIELLLSGEDMSTYTTPSKRGEVIGRKELSQYARDLLERGSLREIEENIAMIPGSQARAWLAVWPPM